ETQITFQRHRISRCLLQHVRWDLDERRTAFRNISRGKFPPGALYHVKRATLGVENPGCAFHNETVQVRRADGFAKRFAKSVEEIEDECFFDLDFFVRALELVDADTLPPPGEKPAGERRN